MSDGICGLEYNSKLYVWEELFDLGGKLFLDERRYVRNERKMEKYITLRRKNAMVILSCVG